MEVCNLEMSYMISMASVLVFGMQCTFLKQSCNLCVQAAQVINGTSLSDQHGLLEYSEDCDLSF